MEALTLFKVRGFLAEGGQPPLLIPPPCKCEQLTGTRRVIMEYVFYISSMRQ